MADVIFGTSGSTGDSKPIVRTEESLMADAASLVKAFPEVWSSQPAVVASVRPEHMYGALWRVRAPCIAGCEVHPSTVFSVEELADACRRHGRILFVTTPSFLEKAMLHPDFASLKLRRHRHVGQPSSPRNVPGGLRGRRRVPAGDIRQHRNGNRRQPRPREGRRVDPLPRRVGEPFRDRHDNRRFAVRDEASLRNVRHGAVRVGGSLSAAGQER